ncbi:hypothetical protein EMIHUDRAFT_100527 [Emiliania huxleyi CCMP1516]|uniref:CCHC-type domain-containing protein n=2 Tax=Emiliania huxleyi TaxID=2903 RepID=A0A0D3JSJ0_EMIH1|nr:hypothetical protein EMIHUDRAFT_100527 [Emiliania huxleyi CCMP1516]EOD26475.1 hypothetical protein EMIHUDRAFT_100527 [Emiliania huxleyi CCMP1516]|eukprot:XP_005778904.1 hypothetical protein EMIHUDRAFT_100527 [Emiliania huxleyi CCMP1516]
MSQPTATTQDPLRAAAERTINEAVGNGYAALMRLGMQPQQNQNQNYEEQYEGGYHYGRGSRGRGKGGGGRGGRGGRGPVECWTCGQMGHIAPHCPTRITTTTTANPAQPTTDTEKKLDTVLESITKLTETMIANQSSVQIQPDPSINGHASSAPTAPTPLLINEDAMADKMADKIAGKMISSMQPILEKQGELLAMFAAGRGQATPARRRVSFGGDEEAAAVETVDLGAAASSSGGHAAVEDDEEATEAIAAAEAAAAIEAIEKARISGAAAGKPFKVPRANAAKRART